MEAKSDTWTITETDGDSRSSCEIARDSVLKVIDKTLTMIELAVELDGELVFFGD